MGIPPHPQQPPVKIKIRKSCPLFFFHIAVTVVCKLFLCVLKLLLRSKDVL